MLRFVALICLSVGCIDYTSGDLKITPDGAVPLGVDLTQHYGVQQDRCYDNDGCDFATPAQLHVALGAGGAVALGQTYDDGFDLTGVAAGTTQIEVTGDDDITQSLSVTTVAVASTDVFVHRPPLLDASGPALAIFAGSQVTIGQRSVTADQQSLLGDATLVLDKGNTDVAYRPGCDCYAVGDVLGTAHLSAPHGALDLDIVDAGAIHAFTADDSSNISIIVGQGAAPLEVFLTPKDSAGHAIVGPGPTPTLAVDTPTIATGSFDETVTAGRALFIHGLAVGSTSFDLTWGSAQLTLSISVVQ